MFDQADMSLSHMRQPDSRQRSWRALSTAVQLCNIPAGAADYTDFRLDRSGCQSCMVPWKANGDEKERLDSVDL